MTTVKKDPAEDLCAQLAELRPVVARFLESRRVQQAAGREGLDDETQDVMIEGYESLSGYRPESGTLMNWLLGIAANIRLRWRRACRKQEERFAPTDDSDGSPASQHSPERAAILSQACERVAEALKTMPAEQRAVFCLVVLQGLSHAEVAKELGISEEASRMKFMRARAYIRERVDDVHGMALLILCGQDRRVLLRTRWRSRLEFIYRAGHAWSALMAAALLGSASSSAAPQDVAASARAAFVRHAMVVRAGEAFTDPSAIDPETIDTPPSMTQAAPVHEHRPTPRGAPPRVTNRLTIKWRR
ncbi:RNA polymerase sigma factor [Polyangium spumosum]|uniref:Sigma-70 family RNA polymerase sigma factor n=1 Tax=Polyangium spumosum TaxID=889282 RepID=A0A6N7Q6X4_9BACT|nr:sigma-70 family RNA polymerase sigma factor [Polyangium spumosum]MRG98465.1 sigma-70 family RNA polymerase sigma factor [Polyangium spumosum]